MAVISLNRVSPLQNARITRGCPIRGSGGHLLPLTWFADQSATLQSYLFWELMLCIAFFANQEGLGHQLSQFLVLPLVGEGKAYLPGGKEPYGCTNRRREIGVTGDQDNRVSLIEEEELSYLDGYGDIGLLLFVMRTTGSAAPAMDSLGLESSHHGNDVSRPQSFEVRAMPKGDPGSVGIKVRCKG